MIMDVGKKFPASFSCEDYWRLLLFMLSYQIEEYPEFRLLYEDVYDLCLNTEKVMGMFSKELQQIDRNTVQLMIDEMQEEIVGQKAQIDEQKVQIDEQKEQLAEKDASLAEKDAYIAELEAKLAGK